MSPENRGLEGVKPSVQKRTNGRKPPVDGPGNPLDPSQDKGSRAGDSLGSPASVSETDAPLVDSDAADRAPDRDGRTDAPAVADDVPESLDYADYDVPGADSDDAQPPFVVESTPEQVAQALEFFEQAKAAESAAQVKRARTRSRVFSIMQYQEHPETGRMMLTQEQVDAGLEVLKDSIYRYAYIWHPFDRLVQVDEGTGEPFCCGLKGWHVHLVLWMTEDRPTIRTVSDAFTIPSPRVRVPKEVAAQEGAAEHKGRGAAERAFFDLAEYLPHESRGKHALKGVTQPERFYLVDTSQDGHPGKYQYGRGRVVANFDFSRELDAHMAVRVSTAEGGTGLRARKLKLRRAVMDGMALVEAREKDRDAYADDLPRLRELVREYTELSGKEIASQIGTTWRKSLVVATGPTRAGKDTLLEELGRQLMWLASLGGFTWSVAKPAGKNTLEGIGRAEIAYHQDMRYKLVPDYDEGLRCFDPNQAIEAATRFTNTAAPTPRVIMASSSETLFSLGYTLKRRASSEHLAEQAGNHVTAPRYPLDIDEFLFRIGWYLEVRKPEGAGDDIDAIRDGMLVAIYRVCEGGGDHREERALTRGGDFIGMIRTQHVLEPVAVVKGCEHAARFLALSIIQERSPDVSNAIPDEQMNELVAGRSQIEAAAAADRAQREAEAVAAAAEEDERRCQREEAQEQRRIAKLEEELRVRRLCTCETFPDGYSRKHEDTCPVLSDGERQRRAEAKKKALDEKVARVRANGGLLIAPK